MPHFKKEQAMNIKKIALVYFLLSLIALGIGLFSHIHSPVINKSKYIEGFGEVTVAQPLWDSKGLALVFANSKQFSADTLKQHLGDKLTLVIVDSEQFFKTYNSTTGQCLDAKATSTAIENLLTTLSLTSTQPLIVAGISEGALLPFLNAQSTIGQTVTNLAIDFSVNLPDNLVLCPPLTTQAQSQHKTLNYSNTLHNHWRAVWTDQPAKQTAIFIKESGNVDTRIAAYDTPLDTVLAEELTTLIGQSDQTAPPLPIVDVPAKTANETTTIFYSGDGGWRDLDRIIATEMAAMNYSVVGVDVLRYFWEHKSPEQTASDLSATMAYYRKNRGIKFFVLAGYSFGADILPAVYNRLSQQDKDSVVLLTLLALAKNADFEIHVSGWLGQSTGELAQSPELSKIPKNKLFCIYGKEEIAETACTDLLNSDATVLELPGGHHFDQDYPKLTRQILDVYRQHGIN